MKRNKNAVNINEYKALLASSGAEKEKLFKRADEVRQKFVGGGIFLRGVIEFSSFCRNSCSYCGLNKNNKNLERYRLSREEILLSVKLISDCNVKTAVLQSGEDDELDPGWLASIIKEIKTRYGLAVTLSVGEWGSKEYELWKKAGADRYLLKIETTDKNLYAKLHAGMSFDNRLNCLKNLQELDYQTGTGIIIGLKGQTLDSIAADIAFFEANDFDMIGIGPFIPHSSTDLCDAKPGDVELTIKAIAVTRIATKNALIPATTALGSIKNSEDFRLDALKCGANVLMPNFTPQPYRKHYEIYPNKRCVDEKPGACGFCMEEMVKSIGRHIDYSAGDSFKKH